MKHTSDNKKRARCIRRSAILLLLAVAAFVCIKRWNAWFGNPVEPAFLSSSVPVRIQLTPGNEGRFSRNVSWQCGDTTAASRLLLVKAQAVDTLAVAAEGTVLRTQGGTTVSYRARLTGLAEGAYTYGVCTGNRQSNWYGFTVSAADTFRFIYLGDIQDLAGGGSETKELLASISRRESGAAFWALGGDVVERPHDQYWNEYFTAIDTIACTMPVIACPGNHEYRKGIAGRLDERFVHVFSHLADSRTDGHAVFDMRYGNAAIITLDSNRDTWTLLSQRNWLEQALERAKDARWKIVILHHPLYSVRGRSRHFFIRRLFDPLIRRYGVDVVLQGHEHCYARMISRDENHMLTTPVHVISQFSSKDYRIHFDESYDRFGNGQRFYQTVNAGSDTLSLQTFTEAGDLYDCVRIVKTGDSLQVLDLAADIPEHFDTALSRIQKIGHSEAECYRREMENRLKAGRKR
jgi:hypothetical protein